MEYENCPAFCVKCHAVGHDIDHCRLMRRDGYEQQQKRPKSPVYARRNERENAYRIAEETANESNSTEENESNSAEENAAAAINLILDAYDETFHNRDTLAEGMRNRSWADECESDQEVDSVHDSVTHISDSENIGQVSMSDEDQAIAGHTQQQR